MDDISGGSAAKAHLTPTDFTSAGPNSWLCMIDEPADVLHARLE